MPLATNTVVVNFEQLAANVLNRAVDVILLDTTFWGGIRPCVKAAGVCETFQLGVAVHSSGELGIQLATMLHLGAVVPNLSFAADAHYHHLVDDIIEGRQAAVRRRRDPRARCARPRRPARPRQAGEVRGALQRAGKLPVRSGSGTARLGAAGAKRSLGRPRRSARAVHSINHVQRATCNVLTCYVLTDSGTAGTRTRNPEPRTWHPSIAAASRRRARDRSRRTPSAPTAAHPPARARRRRGASRRRALRDSWSRRRGSECRQAVAHPVPRRRPAPAAPEAPAPSGTRPARRHLEERFLHRALVVERRLGASGLRERHLRSGPAGGEERLGQARRRGPCDRATAEQRPERRALHSAVSGQRDRGEVGRPGDADLGIGGDDVLFGRLDVGPPLEQRRRQSRRHFRRVRLGGQLAAARDRPGESAEQDAR